MLLQDFIPAPDIREFVQLFRIVHFQFAPGQPIPFKAYPPRPEHCLAFYPYDTERVQYTGSGKEINHIPVVLYGQFSEVTNRMIGSNFLVFQIVFYPGALYRLTGMPACELNNQYLAADWVLPKEVNEINEKLREAGSYQQMIMLASQFIRKLAGRCVKPGLPVDEACRILLRNQPHTGIRQIADDACLSLRQLERKFKERTGVNPKLYERIIRFDRAFRLKNSKPQFDWLRIAIECGYHDYQHLAKEYKDFTGLNPAAFHAIEAQAPERRFGLSEGYYNHV